MPATGVHAQALKVLRAMYLHTARRNVVLFGELSKARDALRRAGIEVIVLKGAHLASSAYVDPGRRPMADIDVLLRCGDLRRAESVLTDHGYRHTGATASDVDYSKHHHVRPFVCPGRAPIELHRALVPTDSPFRIDADALWARARTETIAGEEFRVLSPEDLVLHLALHAAYNHRFRVPLRALCDIDVAIQHYEAQFEWRRLAAIANDAEAEQLLYGTLCVVKQALGTRIPSTALAALGHAGCPPSIVNAIQDFVLADPPILPTGYEQMGEQHTPYGKFRVVMRSLFPSRQRLVEIYHLRLESKWSYVYYLFRPVDLLVRRGRVMIDIICGTRPAHPALEWNRRRLVINRWLDQASAPGSHENTER